MDRNLTVSSKSYKKGITAAIARNPQAGGQRIGVTHIINHRSRRPITYRFHRYLYRLHPGHLVAIHRRFIYRRHPKFSSSHTDRNRRLTPPSIRNMRELTSVNLSIRRPSAIRTQYSSLPLLHEYRTTTVDRKLDRFVNGTDATTTRSLISRAQQVTQAR